MKTLFLTTAFLAVSCFGFSNFEKTNKSLSTSNLANADLTLSPTAACTGTMTLNFSSATGSSITVNWVTPPTAAWYSFRYKESSSATWINTGTLGLAATSRTFSSLLANTSYDIEGRMFCSDGTPGPWSATVVASTNPLSGCELPPAAIAATVSGSTATATWTSVSGAGWYSIRYNVDGGAWINGGTVSAASTSKTLTGLQPCATYIYEIRSHCPSGYASAWIGTTFSSASMTLSGTQINGNSVMTSWVSVPGALWYEFRYKEASSPTWISGGTQASPATSKLISGLNPTTTYNFESRVFCANSATPVWSPTLNVTTGALTSCGAAPAVMYGTVSGLNVDVTWTSVTNAAWYEFRYKEASAGTWTPGGTAGAAATTKSYMGLMPSTAYDFEARTFCANGTPSPWAATTFTTTAPVGCEVSPVIDAVPFATTTSSITISWTPVASAAWYDFHYKESTSGTWIYGGTAGSAATNKTFSGFLSGTIYEFEMRSFCPNGSSSDWSGKLAFSTDGDGPATLVVNTDKTESTDVAVKAIESTAKTATTVYPNPFADKLNIEIFMDEASANTSIKLMDMSGRLVREVSVSTETGVNTLTLDVQELSSGMYTMFVYQNGQLLHTDKVKKN